LVQISIATIGGEQIVLGGDILLPWRASSNTAANFTKIRTVASMPRQRIQGDRAPGQDGCWR
jgi:hypothetical protein